jgi:hypothetical protein
MIIEGDAERMHRVAVDWGAAAASEEGGPLQASNWQAVNPSVSTVP